MSNKKEALKAVFSKDKFTSRRFKHGGLAIIIIILFLVGVVVINMIAGTLNDKYPYFSWDLTRDQTFDMTQESIDYVKGLDKDIKITVLNDEDSFVAGGQYYQQANNIIKQYPQYNSRITLEYVDVNKNPAYLNTLTGNVKEDKRLSLPLICLIPRILRILPDRHRLISCLPRQSRP